MRLYSIAFLAVLSVFQVLPEKTLLQSLLKSSIHVPEVDQAPPTDGDAAKNKKELFNYTAFWETAMERAQESLRTEKPPFSLSSPCPKVYVYNLTEFNLIDTKNHPRQFGSPVRQFRNARDKKFQGYLHKTNQYSFASILEDRLLKSTKCRTLDPNEADLFFAPILSSPKGSGGWTSTCKAINGKKVRDALPFLNNTNACRHFIAIGKGHTDVPYCKGWFLKPIQELRPFFRLAYSSFNFELDEHGGHFYQPDDDIAEKIPNLVSVPYPSSLHYSSNTSVPHFSSSSIKRDVLMSFIGKDNHGDTKVRERIHKSCKTYGNSKICDYRAKYDPVKDATSKAQAIFCLEPAGDTPGRKSLSDSITFGCIPVLFSELTDNVAPWHWLDWKERARILVPRQEFVKGRIDLKTLLETMPRELLELFQKTLKTKSRQFQYSLDDDQEDGIRIILDNLYREAKDRERQGVCGH